MQYISDNFKRLVADNLKIGRMGKPRCVVEVDRMAFIPGRTEQLTIEDFDIDTEVRIEKEWIAADENGFPLGSTTVNTDNIVFPVQGMSLANVTSNYGMRNGRMHQGIDIALNVKAFPEKRGVGTPILACWGGKVSKVVRTNLYSGYGIYVDIVHPNGYRSRYAHLSSVYVNPGDSVVAGQMIGRGGNTGDVRTNGKAVLGDYNDPNSMRSKGFGAHLHFEIHKSKDGKGNFTKVNPRPYLDGSIKPVNSISNKGMTVDEGSLQGYKGTLKLYEPFVRRNWFKKKEYSFYNYFEKLSTVEKVSIGNIRNWNTLIFRKMSPFSRSYTTGMRIHLKMSKPGYLNVRFRSNFLKSHGDLFYIKINDSPNYAAVVENFKGMNKIQELKKVYVPAGDVTIHLMLKWGGKKRENFYKKFSFGSIEVREIASTKEAIRNAYASKVYSNKQEEFSQLQNGYWEEREITDFIFSKNPQTFDLSVGEFVYMDTITLENVESCDIATSLEQESAEAIITLSNPDGYYSPEYNPYFFPELFVKSPFSYRAGGYQIGTLSNNTPIRIYMGYGLNLVRVFTGLIDKVDISNNPPIITITARDMYKKISDKVLTETKQYPNVNLIDDFPGGTPQSNNSFINTIAPSAIEGYKKYSILPSITIAQAILESGWGKYKVGNNVFGLKAGSGWTGKTRKAKTTEYKNGEWVSVTATFRDYDSVTESILDHQKLIGTASRYVKVRQANNYKEAAKALQEAHYATDPNYASKLINIIESNNLAQYDNMGSNIVVSSGKEEGSGEVEKVAWLKSAVVQDLIEHAGMFGWRNTAEDLQYPDAVIEESYLISINQNDGTYVRAVPGKEGEFEVANINSILTPKGWLNPYADEYGRTFHQYKHRVGECISEVIKDTNYRSYCDRYGTYRLETIKYNKPVVETFTYTKDLISIDKTLDFSRARSHILVIDENGDIGSFIDKEILIELKGEVRTASVEVPWAKSYEAKKLVATRLFQDMKRVCRTAQIASIFSPKLDLLDRIRVIDKDSATNSIYTIKGMRISYGVNSGLLQFLELFWSEEGTVV